MKKRLWLPILYLLVLCGCAYSAPQNQDTSEEQNREDQSIIHCATAEGLVTPKSVDDNAPCQIRLTKQQETKESGYSLVIEVDTGSAVLKKELDSNVIPLSHEHILFLGDVDGDEIKEILIHHDTGGCGGFGSYQTWVLKVENNEILTLFENYAEFDTGFESRFLDSNQLEVKNRITGYNRLFELKESYKTYISNSQEIPSGSFSLDSFYGFEPKDVDDDGISEIHCKQYTHILDHADYTGTAHSVLKFNKETQAFEVVDAWYELNTEE